LDNIAAGSVRTNNAGKIAAQVDCPDGALNVEAVKLLDIVGVEGLNLPRAGHGGGVAGNLAAAGANGVARRPANRNGFVRVDRAGHTIGEAAQVHYSFTS
jgi:hypothetical protein